MPRFIAQRGLASLPVFVGLTLAAPAASQLLQLLLVAGAFPLVLASLLDSAAAVVQPHVVLQLGLFPMRPPAPGSCSRPGRCKIRCVWHPGAILAKLRVAKFVRC